MGVKGVDTGRGLESSNLRSLEKGPLELGLRHLRWGTGTGTSEHA